MESKDSSLLKEDGSLKTQITKVEADSKQEDAALKKQQVQDEGTIKV